MLAEAQRIDVPENALVLLVGAAGSGKSTLAARLFPAAAILSSDAIRAELTGDPADQTRNQVAFRILHERVERGLAAGLLTIVDATNIAASARLPLRRLAAAHGRPAMAIVLDLPGPLCVARNGSRAGRVVPQAAVHLQLVALRQSLEQGDLGGESFARIIVLTSPAAIDGLSVGLTKPVEAATLSSSALPRRSRRRHP